MNECRVTLYLGRDAVGQRQVTVNQVGFRHQQGPVSRTAHGRAWWWAYFSLIALWVWGGAALADESHQTARQWLDKVATAAQTFNYQGTFIYRRDDQLVAMRIVHVADQAGQRERLVSLNGALREVIRDSNGTVCILPERKQFTLSQGGAQKHFPAKAFEHVADFDKYYGFSLGGKDRIAGRLARVVLIEPRDGYRYGYRVWVDESTGLLLQSDLVNEKGVALEQMMFTAIDVHTTPTVDMLKAVSMEDLITEKVLPPKPPAVATDASVWKLAALPQGFMVAERYHHPGGDAAPALEHIVLTDGMASVSVFIEPLGGKDQRFEGSSHMGAVNAYGAVVADHQLTVVGEVPMATVQMIGRAVAPRNSGEQP